MAHCASLTHMSKWFDVQSLDFDATQLLLLLLGCTNHDSGTGSEQTIICTCQISSLLLLTFERLVASSSFSLLMANLKFQVQTSPRRRLRQTEINLIEKLSSRLVVGIIHRLACVWFRTERHHAFGAWCNGTGREEKGIDSKWLND